MIHGSSPDPVLIKKIALKVWLLRDEIEAVINERIKNLKEGEEAPSIEDLIQEYRSQGHFQGQEEETGLRAVEDLPEEDDGEAAMLAAMQASEDDEEEEESEQEQVEEESNSEIQATETQALKQGDNYLIRQRSPALSEDKVYHAKTILSEVNMSEIYFFSTKEFLSGQSIVIEFLIPKRFIVNANILFCRSFNMKSRIISEKRMPFRIGANFSFLKDGERTLLRNFVESIEPDIPEAPAQEAQPSAQEEDEDDLFDSLDDMEI